MSDTVLLALIAALPGVLAAVLAIVVQLRTTRKVEEVRELVNGLAHEKAKASDLAAHRQGELAGRDYERRRSEDIR